MGNKDESERERGTVSMSLVDETLRLAQRPGVDVGAITEQAGIHPQFLSSTRGRVTSYQYGFLWSSIARELDDEFFGQDTHPMRSGSFALMTHATLSSSNGGSALENAVAFMRLILDDVKVEVDSGSSRVRLLFGHRHDVPALPMFGYATWFIMVYGLVCWLVGRRIPVLHASFRCSCPSDLQEYRAMFCEELHFEASESYVDFAPGFMTLPIVQTPKTVETFLRDAPGNFIVKYRNPDSLAARVRAGLGSIPANDWPAVLDMATKLNLAEATLRRKLSLEGHTYQSIKDDLRRDIAINELLDLDRTIGDIAETVGFAEPSAFHRAFRKWTGMRPAEYRLQHKNQKHSTPPA